jgi:glycine oxidase
MRSFDSLVIGAGVIGCSLARSLAGAGHRVAVVERGAPGAEASGAAAGMLSPSAEAEPESPLFHLCRASLACYPAWVQQLQKETGVDVRYRTEGTLLVFHSASEQQQAAAALDWQRTKGVVAEPLTPAQLREREPHLAPAASAFYLPGDHQIDNRLLMHALVQSCRRRGVELILGHPVLSVERKGNFVTGVVLGESSPERIDAPRVINTAGAWAGQISADGLSSIPVRPVKGHMVALETAEPQLRHVIRSNHVYLVPREGGRVLVGSTMEEAGFDKTPRAAAITGLLTAAQQLAPGLAEAAITEFWAGLRPAAPDGLPILGPTEVKGYWLATGHFRNGILLAPITAEIMSCWLLMGKPACDVGAFLPSRLS